MDYEREMAKVEIMLSSPYLSKSALFIKQVNKF